MSIVIPLYSKKALEIFINTTYEELEKMLDVNLQRVWDISNEDVERYETRVLTLIESKLNQAKAKVLRSRPFKLYSYFTPICFLYKVYDYGSYMKQVMFCWIEGKWEPVQTYNEDGGRIIQNPEEMKYIRETYRDFQRKSG